MTARDKTKRRESLGFAWGAAGVLLLLTVLVVLQTPLEDADRWLAARMTLAPGGTAWEVVLWVTEWGDSATILPIMAVISLMLLRAGEAYLLLPQWGGYLLARLVTEGLKHLIGRARPPAEEMVRLAAQATSPSFPSGHATSAAFVCGLLAVLVMRSDMPVRRRRGAVLVLAVIAVAVAASRVLLGVHYVSDVLGGIASGGLALALAMVIAGRRP